MTDFMEWKKFDYINATVQLWVFKKSTTSARFKAWHVRTDTDIEQLFRDAVLNSINDTTEDIAYSPISQNNESSCLLHSLAESEGVIALLNVVDSIEAEHTDAELKHLKGAAGYLVKFQNDGQTVYGVRKTAPSWKPKVRSSFINAIFNNGELSVTPDETFSFDSFFDFYCFNETIIIKSKRSYESTMSDKMVYQQSFDQLSVDPDFNSIFSDIQPLKDYVGTNAMHLRRIVVIQTKRLYSRPGFTRTVERINRLRGYGLNFDENGRMVVCSETTQI